MELRHLRYFVAVAEEGSISRAAARLNIQQPPLGQQIRDLEYELGVSLFDRHPKKISLNAAGAVFLADARDILKRAGQAVENVRRYDKGEAGHLSVGFTSSASLHVLAPKLLQQFRLSYPLVKIAVEESETYELILALQEGRIDAALLHIDANRFPDLASTVLSEEDMIVAVPLGHPLADEGLGPITLKMLEGQDVVIYRRPDGPGIFERILQSLDRAGVTPAIVDEVYRIVAAINLVAGGRGVTIVPASMQVLHPEAIAYRALAPGQLSPLPLCIAYRRDLKLSIVRNFVALTKEIAAVPAHMRGRA